MEYKAVHFFYEEGEKILELENAMMYDTASPYKYCAVALWRIGRKIKEGVEVKIISNGREFTPSSLEEFKSWIVNHFNNEYNGGFEKYVDSVTQPFS